MQEACRHSHRGGVNGTQDLAASDRTGVSEVVYDTSAEQEFTVIIPKKIVLGSDKTAEYNVTVKGDVAQGSRVKVEPRDDVEDRDGINFVMTAEKSGGSKNADVTQADTEWGFADIVANDYAGTAKPGTVDGSELTFGIWQGSLTFLINFEDEYAKPHEHSFVSEIVKEATCTEPGMEKLSCVCGESETHEVAALGHSFEGNICTRCGMAVGSLSDWNYTLNENEGTVLLTKFTGTSPDVRVYQAYMDSEGNIYETRMPDNFKTVNMFSYRAKTITFDEGIYWDNVTDMSYMFSYCSNLTSLDVSGLDTSNVMNMSDMFNRCENLASLDVSGFDTSNVTDMSNMFNGCSNLASLDVSGFDTSNVTNMGGMFNGCRNLASLDVSGFDTSNVTRMSNMFNGCENLVSLDVSGFDTSNVTNMGSMFNGCINLASLDVSGFDTSNVTDMYNMFSSCYSITSLDLGKFDTSNVTRLSYMFMRCEKLTSLDLRSFDTSSATTMEWMFYGCTNLANIDVTTGKWTDAANTEGMFKRCGTDHLTYH